MTEDLKKSLSATAGKLRAKMDVLRLTSVNFGLLEDEAVVKEAAA